jgi:hypothetical protein
MSKIPSPLHTKKIPKAVSKPTPTADAAATVAESMQAPPVVASKKTRRAPDKPVPDAQEPRAELKEVESPGAAKSAKSAKPHKPKLVRDSFTIPKDEYQVLEALKGRALTLERHVRKSELLRAGIQVLAAMNDRAFLKAIGAVPTLKTGRPKID